MRLVQVTCARAPSDLRHQSRQHLFEPTTSAAGLSFTRFNMTTKARPSPLSTKSFTRYEPSTTLPAASVRSRASTIASPVFDKKSIEDERQDVFNKTQNEDDEEMSPELNKTHSLPERFDELPVELISLTDRYVTENGC